MKRTATVILVAAVGFLGALALADALRPGAASGPSRTPETTTRHRPEPLLDTLRREAISGLVLYSDENCRLHSLVLPRMADDVVHDESGADEVDCRFGLSGGRVLKGDIEVSADGSRTARCRRNRVDVLDPAGQWRAWPQTGCPVALRPDGRVTQVRDDRIVQGRRVLYTRADLREAARAHPSLAAALDRVRHRVYVTDFAWLDERRVIVALDVEPAGGAPLFLAALFDGKALIGLDSSPLGPYEDWLVSPSGEYAASSNGIIVASDGRATDPPAGVPPGQAVAFSPDERWLAYVNGTSIYLVPTPLNDDPDRFIRLPKAAQDLVWQPVTSGTSPTGG